jgi:hypothetical protein
MYLIDIIYVTLYRVRFDPDYMTAGDGADCWYHLRSRKGCSGYPACWCISLHRLQVSCLPIGDFNGTFSTVARDCGRLL